MPTKAELLVFYTTILLRNFKLMSFPAIHFEDAGLAQDILPLSPQKIIRFAIN